MFSYFCLNICIHNILTHKFYLNLTFPPAPLAALSAPPTISQESLPTVQEWFVSPPADVATPNVLQAPFPSSVASIRIVSVLAPTLDPLQTKLKPMSLAPFAESVSDAVVPVPPLPLLLEVNWAV